MKFVFPCLLLILTTFFFACDEDEKTAGNLSVSSVHVGNYPLNLTDFTANTAAPTGDPIIISFSKAVDQSTIASSVIFRKKHTTAALPAGAALSADGRTLTLTPSDPLVPNATYVISVGETLRGSDGEILPAETVVEFTTAPLVMEITSVLFNDNEVEVEEWVEDVSPDLVLIRIFFSTAVDPATVDENSVKIVGANTAPLTLQLNGTVLHVISNAALQEWSRYQLIVTDNVKGVLGEQISPLTVQFYTRSSDTPDHPLLTDDELLTLVQHQTFKYFWDFAEPSSGMARERNTSGELVTSGGSGFGLMALIVGIERRFIGRAEGVARLEKILTYLESADRFHGAWPHWLSGTTGAVIPFSANDNGGDLVETSFLVQGLITFRQYLNNADLYEKGLIDRINNLWQTVEWNWYTKGGEEVLYWHWSPDKEWTMNHQIRGYNETLITYVLAAASPTFPIAPNVYHNGYARAGAIANGKSFYNLNLPLGEDYGGPLFFSHYSFLGLDPRNLQDQYANYWTQNVNHSLIHNNYSIENPKNYVGYSDENWGLTASDNHLGYSAHSPRNDLGVISPTAALSSFPYTPQQSMKALKFFYYKVGDKLWGDYGFYDSFNLTEQWTADSYLAIDQGPIVVMIENYRTGLLWQLFMSAPEVQTGLTNLGFTY